MTNRQWRQFRKLCVIAVSFLVILALSAWPLNKLPSTALTRVSSTVAGQEGAALKNGAKQHRMAPVVAVIGSGLAGLSAAYELSQKLQAELPTAKVVVFEKNGNLGGNSAKASSGINAINAAAGDSAQAYAADTTKSGGGFSDQDLVNTLVSHSVDGLQFLEGLGLNLSSIVRLGGHSYPRTHSNPTGPNVGFALIKAVASKVEAAPNVQIEKNTKVSHVAAAHDGRIAISYSGVQPPPPAAAAAVIGHQPRIEDPPLPAVLHVDALVVATGGFAANKQLLKKHCPAAAELPTTNGPWATGDGIELGEGVGAALVDMEHVQVHPTGFVDPADPTAGTKWLAPEKLRGCGAILLNKAGHRFVDELTTRDKVTAGMLQQDGSVAWLLLGASGATMFGEGTLGFYVSKSMVKKFDTLAAAAEHMDVPLSDLQQQVEQYNAAAAAGNDSFGKQYFPSTIDPASAVWVGQVTPVVHYCMGGLKINDKSQVLKADGSAIRGLFAAGEVSGGLHGANRLGGNSLAECVVFGRIAGQNAAEHVLPTVHVLESGQLAGLKQPLAAM